MRRKRSDDRLLTCTFASAYYFYPVPFNCCRYILSLLPLSSPPSISALIFLPVSLRKPTQASLCRQARPRYVEEALLFLMRYPLWGFKHPQRPLPPATPAQSGGQGKATLRRRKMEGLRGKDNRGEAWESKRDAWWAERQRDRGEADLFKTQSSHVRSGLAFFLLHKWKV